jgi:hypothetical protein
MRHLTYAFVSRGSIPDAFIAVSGDDRVYDCFLGMYLEASKVNGQVSLEVW